MDDLEAYLRHALDAGVHPLSDLARAIEATSPPAASTPTTSVAVMG